MFKMRKIIFILLAFLIVSCSTKERVDLIVTNANIYTVDEDFKTAEAFTVTNGKFVAVGSTSEINQNYQSATIIDADGKTIVPGLIDAHCHFLRLGESVQAVDLVNTKSFDEVVKRVVDFQNKKNLKFITGVGWDQNDWEVKEYPNKKLLDQLFPNTPIALTRVDGHAIFCNQAALDLGNVTVNSKIDGGEVVLKDGELTGVLIDNAESLVMNYWPKITREDKVNALLAAQEICFDMGLTTVDDAGLSIDDIEIIDSLQNTGALNMRIYAMVSATKQNLDYYLNKGIVKTKKLNVRSFKYYADGALGSRGAMLRTEYSDQPGHLGLMVNTLEDFQTTAERIAKSNYQMNTHAIGDSANRSVLQTYHKLLKDTPGRRWRVEHAQVLAPEDFDYYKDIVPSIQPTHATSDMYWAEERIGSVRVKGAYAFKDLLKKHGKVALGTDFPVEHVSPFYTFYAAVSRQDLEQYPKGGFQPENALTREEALRGMTVWAAYSNFEENEKGSIEVGKFGDFIVLDKDIMKVPIEETPHIRALHTFVDGEEQ